MSIDRRVSWKVRRRAFHLWQRRPHEVVPIKEGVQVCASCGTQFEGNYCPRCGQSAMIGRFSFKTAIKLFVDVWGLGNRGMFRSIRDLLLRPGYMIRDYLRGMQSAYFPPFKMFFLLTTFSLLVTHVFQSGETQTAAPEAAETQTAVVVAPADTLNTTEVVAEKEAKAENDADEVIKKRMKFVKWFVTLKEDYPSIFSFLMLLLYALPLYLFFRHSPAIPDLRFSEQVVALTYVSCMTSIYTIIGSILHLTVVFDLLSIVAICVALHQFSGFRYRRLIPILLLSLLLFILAMAAVMSIAALLVLI